MLINAVKLNINTKSDIDTQHGNNQWSRNLTTINNVNFILILIDFALARAGAGWRGLARAGAD